MKNLPGNPKSAADWRMIAALGYGLILSTFGAVGGWAAVLLGQPALWTVPLAFAVMICVSLLTQRTLPGNVGQVMLRMHLPEALSRQAYRTSLG